MVDAAVAGAVTAPRWQEFEEVAHSEVARLFRVAHSILGDPGEAEDAVQDTMLRAWRAWDTLSDEDRRRAWLTRICVNRSLDVRARLRLRWPLHGTMPSDAAMPEGRSDGDGAERLRDPDLDRVFARLPRHQRAVVALHYGHGYTLDECATLLGCRPGTVRTHLSRALTRFRKELEDG